MKNLVVLSGAGMSAESGISTFRDAGGLWGQISGDAGSQCRRICARSGAGDKLL